MGDLVTNEQSQEARPKHPGGRPTLYSDAIAQEICDKICKGVRAEAAALAMGLTRETFFDWMRDNKEFSYAVLRADAEAEGTYTESMHAAATGTQGNSADWKAAESWLKRRRRAAYGDTIDFRQIPPEAAMRFYLQQQAAITEDGAPALIESAEDVL